MYLVQNMECNANEKRLTSQVVFSVGSAGPEHTLGSFPVEFGWIGLGNMP